jgi:hypothetical protein
MKTYWDYNESERANLTYEEVQSLQKFELMSAGILTPEPPTFQDETPPPVPTQKFYQVTHVDGVYSTPKNFGTIFRTMEDAEAFIALRPAVVESNWQFSGNYFKEVSGLQVQVVELPTEADQVAHKPRLIELKSIVESNKKLKDEYSTACKAVTDACVSMWDDYRTVTSKQHRYKKIVDTFNAYVNECDGNEEIAMRFLLKATDRETIEESFEWFGEVAPLPALELAEERSAVTA